MMKHLVITTAIILALATSAWAQTQQPASQTAPAATAAPQATQSGTTADKAIIPEETGTQLRAGDLMGKTVIGPDGKEVGTVDDLIFDEQKKIVGVVVGVGGFLGIGKKDVGLNWQQAKFLEDQAGAKKIQISLTKADLKAAPEFKTKEQQKAEKQAAAAAQQQQIQLQQQSAPPPAGGTAPAQPGQ
jgi:sporulation protein YlmC with PRC-barrel domain